MLEPSSEYLTIDEVASRYRVSVPTVRFWRHKGTGPRGVRVGTRVLFPMGEVDRFDKELRECAADGRPARI